MGKRRVYSELLKLMFPRLVISTELKRTSSAWRWGIERSDRNYGTAPARAVVLVFGMLYSLYISEYLNHLVRIAEGDTLFL